MASNKTLNVALILVFSALGLMSAGCAKGEKGDAGPGGRIVSTINCTGTVRNLTGSASALNGLDIEYDAVLTEAGDVYATAAVIDEATQASGTSFYSVGQQGSSTARVLITSDYIGIADGGFWNISLNRNTLEAQAVYTDPSLVSPANMYFTASACKRNDW